MSDEIKRVKKQIEIEVVEMNIEVSSEFYEKVEHAKKLVEDKRGEPMSYGEYIEQALNDLVEMYDGALQQIEKAKSIIAQQDAALGQAGIIEQPEEESGEEDVPKTVEGVPEDLYAHIVKDEDKHTMYQ